MSVMNETNFEHWLAVLYKALTKTMPSERNRQKFLNYIMTLMKESCPNLNRGVCVSSLGTI